MADTPVMIVAKTIWGEARGCGFPGMRHVACVIKNRADKPGWWGHDFSSVCLMPYQFSCWNADDPNRAKMETVSLDDPWFVQAWQIAKNTVDGTLTDQVCGADSYYATSMAVPPKWAAKAKRVYCDGWFNFYVTVPVVAQPPPAVVEIKDVEE